MPFFAPVVWLATLIRWSLAQAFGGAAYIVDAISFFPAFVLELWSEELSNYAYISEHIVWCVDAIDNLRDGIDEWLADKNHYFYVTIPTEFHDFAGEILGEVAWEHLKAFFAQISIIVAAIYLYTLLKEVPPTVQPSPTVANEGATVESTNVASPAPTATLSFQPMYFKNFRGDSEFFKQVGVCYPLSYNTPFQLSLESRSLLVPSPMIQPAKSQATLAAPFEQQTPLSSIRTPYEKVDFAFAATEAHPAPTSDATPYDTMMRLSGTLRAPESIPSTQQTVSLCTFETVCGNMKAYTMELRYGLQAFIDNHKDTTGMRVVLASLDGFLLEASNSLRAHKSQLTPAEALETGWCYYVNLFWDTVQPHGYLIHKVHGELMLQLLQDFASFGRFLQLPLLDLNMTPPHILSALAAVPPSLPSQQNPPRLDVHESGSVIQNTVIDSLPAFSPSISTAMASQSTQTNVLSTPSLSQQTVNSFTFQPQRQTRGISRPGHYGNGRGVLSRRVQLAPRTTQPTQNTTTQPPQNTTQTPRNTTPVQPVQQLSVLVRSNPNTFSMAPDRISEWNISDNELLALTKENLAWTSDAQLWTYNPVTDLALNSNLPAHGKAYHAHAELDGVALKFKRATVVLRLQAHADSPTNHMANTPKLMAAMKDTLDKANKMHKECSKSSLHAREWVKAFVFFHSAIMFDDAVEQALESHYGEASWNPFCQSDELAVMYFIPPTKEGARSEDQKTEQ
ncbi:hypothetical protein IQ06DRAFT_347217 [Phaeosphaeriaceae sp. SRC1lsM3a]|nr:hypothetical protein IQ06DRAFT_347217 [Stagonospora sp. SRC1lsM3a]